ncbi:hypothetical protein THAOC_29445, partial [Thalassiosira oceanica]
VEVDGKQTRRQIDSRGLVDRRLPDVVTSKKGTERARQTPASRDASAQRARLERGETLTFHYTNTRLRLRNVQVEPKESNESSPGTPPDDCCEMYELSPQR